jgi:hypothetical protein
MPPERKIFTMPLSLEKLEKLAPDQASIDAARKLLKPTVWRRLATDGQNLVWGECQGSGATPYRVVLSEPDAGYKCTCPSRKLPCKHSLALMWMRAEGKVPFQPADVPDWVKDWLSRRRPGTAQPTEPDDKPKVSLHPTPQQPEEPPDPKAEARAAALRERNRKEREASILAGLDDLDVWLADQVARGMATFVAQSSQACKLIAQRLVDAKASGLAGRLESLPSRLFTLPEQTRSLAAVEELGQIYLLAEAYKRQESLPGPLRADVRQAIGWAMTRETLLSDATALRVRATWHVVAVLTEIQPDRLRRIETWLWREDAPTGPQFALLLDFVPLATGAAVSGYTVSDAFEAELVFYPSALPLRAQVVTATAAAASSELQIPADDLEAAYASYEAAMRDLPWVGAWPISFRNARVRRSDSALFVCAAGDHTSSLALPLKLEQSDLAAPLAIVDGIDGIGLWDGRSFTLCWAETQLGRWVNA